jgi:circadian clock protein KaiB
MTSYALRLYVAGEHGVGRRAERNLREQLDRRGNAVELEVVDIVADSDAAERHSILVVPTLERLAPSPVRRIVGFAGDYEDVLDMLDMPAAGQPQENKP